MKRQPHRCAKCGSEDVTVSHRTETVDFRGLTLEVDGLAETVCGNCGLTWTTDGQEQDNLTRLKTAFGAKRDAVREREGLLTAEQIEYVLNRLQLSRTDASALFGGGPNAFTKYANGDVLQSFAMDRLLRLTLAVGSPAVRYLRIGRDAPLALNAAGYFIAPAMRGNVGSVASMTTTTEIAKFQIVQAKSAQVEAV